MKFAFLRFFRSLDQDINLQRVLLLFSWIVSIFLGIYTIILLSLPLYETSAHKGIVFATDNDGGRAIETSIATRWYNSNHFGPYGNVYYRLSHSLADLISLPETGHSTLELKEKDHNFALKLVSLFSLVA